MHPNGGGHDHRPPFGNDSFNLNETFPPRMNDSDHQHHGFPFHHGNETHRNVTFIFGNFSSPSPDENDGDGGGRPGIFLINNCNITSIKNVFLFIGGSGGQP